MPPKVKVKKGDILKAAFTLVREEGMDSLNARRIACELGCSTQPIYGSFQTMNDLIKDVLQLIEKYHNHYSDKVVVDENFYMNVGITCVDFALEEPNFFRLLFMSESFYG